MREGRGKRTVAVNHDGLAGGELQFGRRYGNFIRQLNWEIILNNMRTPTVYDIREERSTRIFNGWIAVDFRSR